MLDHLATAQTVHLAYPLLGNSLLETGYARPPRSSPHRQAAGVRIALGVDPPERPMFLGMQVENIGADAQTPPNQTVRRRFRIPRAERHPDRD
jgi:hypothetical protein